MDVVRRNPKSFLSEKGKSWNLKGWIVIIRYPACGLRWPGFCITKAITFEKGYNTSEIQVPDIDIQR